MPPQHPLPYILGTISRICLAITIAGAAVLFVLLTAEFAAIQLVKLLMVLVAGTFTVFVLSGIAAACTWDMKPRKQAEE